MKKIRVGIIGYGNLGKSIEQIVANDDSFKLVAVFSKRLVKSNYTVTDFPSNIGKYKNKIDVMFLCGGSSSNLMEQAKEALNYFCCIDAFDTHKNIPIHLKNCDTLAKENKKVAFCSFGWDPGLFSLMRVLFTSLGNPTYTAWGKGVSQGHSEAIRCIKGVKDAIQYTVPNIKIIEQLKSGKLQRLENDKNLHLRECYIVAEPENRPGIIKKVIEMPNYFLGYQTKIRFIDEYKMQKHKNLFHAGEVFTVGNEMNFKLSLKSNPDFTAKVLVVYSKVLFKYYLSEQYGTYTILDIPFSHLLKNSEKLI